MTMWEIDFAERLKSARPSERGQVIDSYAGMTGYSRPQLYRIAKKNGFETGRKRSDKGKLKSGLTDGQIDYAAALISVTARENKGPIMPVERAMQIMEDNGILDVEVSPATMNRILRARQISKRHMKAPEPHASMRSLHPNHVHAMDVSVCIQYYLKNGRLGLMDERDFYKNKPKNFEKIKTRLLRYLLVDHFSGEFHIKYFDTTGETQENLFIFLKEAWGNKNDDKRPFRGVPFVLLMDNGAANTSKAIVAMLERMDVEVPKGLPYNARRQGVVERLHDVVECWFESGLRLQPAWSVDDLNVWAADFFTMFKATKPHTRTNMPRTQCWLSITTTQLRELPADDLLHDAFANPEEECTVQPDYSIRYRGNRYNVKHLENVAIRSKVKAALKPLKWPKVDVTQNGKVYECEPITVLPAHLGGFRSDAAIIGQEYKSQPETLTQQAEKRFENMAYGEDRKKDSIPFEGLRVFGHHADKVENVAFIEKQGTPLEVDRGIMDRHIPIMEFFKRLRNAVGAITPEMNQELRAKYGESIDVKEAEEVIRRISEGGTEEGVKTA